MLSESSILNDDQQLQIATKIKLLLKDGEQTSVTPLMVKIIIDNFFDDLSNTCNNIFDKALNKIPSTIPKVYYKYLEKTNPENPHVDNYLSHENMFKIVELFAYLSIENNYIPQDFEKQKAVNDVIEKFPEMKIIDFTKRLIDNTIINQKQVLGTYYLRFNLDSFAEYLGAEYLYKSHKDSGDLKEFTEVIMNLSEDAQGFKNAFKQIRLSKDTST